MSLCWISHNGYARRNWVVVVPYEFRLKLGLDFDVLLPPIMNDEQISAAPATAQHILNYTDLGAAIATTAIVIKTGNIVYIVFIPDATETAQSATNTIITINGQCSVSSEIDDTSVEIGCVINVIEDKYELVGETNSQMWLKMNIFVKEKHYSQVYIVVIKQHIIFIVLYVATVI